MLGDDALQAVLSRRLQQFLARAGEGVGDADRRPRRQHLLQEFAPLFESDAAQVVAIQVEQVEGEIDHRGGAHQVSDGVGVGVGDARLDEVELRDALGIEHRDLAIEHGLRCGDVVRHHGQFGILPLAAQPAARLQADLFVVQEGHGAHAIPLHLEQPILAARHALGEHRLHGLDRRRHLRELRAPFRLRQVDAFWLSF